MNEIIQSLKINATNGKENFCYISEKQLNAMKELSKRETKENQQLKEDINKLQKELNEENLQCSRYAIKINDLKENNKQLKDNWNKLKNFITKEYYMYLPFAASTKSITILIDKMQELEGSDSE